MIKKLHVLMNKKNVFFIFFKIIIFIKKKISFKNYWRKKYTDKKSKQYNNWIIKAKVIYCWIKGVIKH